MSTGIEFMTLPMPGHTERSARESASVPPSLSASIAGLDADAEARRVARAVGHGDESAFQQLYERYQERLFRFTLVLGHGDESLASETVQSVFVTAARKLRRVDNEDHLWNWLARVARQQLAKAWRRREQEARFQSLPELPDGEVFKEADTMLESHLDAALAAMESDERQLLEWCYFDDLSHKEIAEQLGVTPKAVSSRLERARARLRALLKRALEHET